MRCIHVAEVEGNPAICYDTGLNPRSFARTKMSANSLVEPGFLVSPDGSRKAWTATGVSEVNNLMRVFGAPFYGERLDSLLDEVSSITQRGAESQQKILRAIVYWIRAKLLLGDKKSSINPGAVFINLSGENTPKGSVFFGPKQLSQRCLINEGNDFDSYNCPDLDGMEEAAFSAGVMLYKLLAQVHPYQINDHIFQDMREGVFLPPKLAIPGLDNELCRLINAALLQPVVKKRTKESGTEILSKMLKILLKKEIGIVKVASLFRLVPKEENNQIERERKSFTFKQKIVVSTRRFYIRNKYVLIGAAIGLFFIVFVAVNMSTTKGLRPSTTGMTPYAVINSYYEAFSNLNHRFMEAVIRGADKSDINVAVNLFAVSRIRQGHEQNSTPPIISARVWKDLGGELPAPDVFGVTDLDVEYLGGAEAAGIIIFRATYLLWFPNEQEPSRRSDEITLKLHRGSWHISEILRTIVY